MVSWCIVFRGNQSFSGQNYKISKLTVSEPFFSRGTPEISVRRDILSRKTLLHILRIYKQPTEYISMSRQRETCFVNSEMPKKINACPSITKSIERHPRLPYCSPPLQCFQPLQTIEAVIAACIMSWARKFPLWRFRQVNSLISPHENRYEIIQTLEIHVERVWHKIAGSF